MTEPAKPTRGLFVTATDTGVGKTYLTALAARSLRGAGLSVGAFKPVCTGAETVGGSLRWGDVEALADSIGGQFPRERICPFCFRAPLAPPVAAAREGAAVRFDALLEGAAWWSGRVEVLLVEGVGGILCPLTGQRSIADLAIALEFPLLVVARLGLGTINHTLLTVEAAQSRGLWVAGIVLNEAEPLGNSPGIEENPVEIARRTNVPVLGVVRHGSTFLEPCDSVREAFDWSRFVATASPT